MKGLERNVLMPPTVIVKASALSAAGPNAQHRIWSSSLEYGTFGGQSQGYWKQDLKLPEHFRVEREDGFVLWDLWHLGSVSGSTTDSCVILGKSFALFEPPLPNQEMEIIYPYHKAVVINSVMTAR